MAGKVRRKKVSPGRVRLDSELYRALTLKAYSQQKSVSEVINEMLKQQATIQEFLKIGFIIVHRDAVKELVNNLTDEQAVESAKKIAGALLEATALSTKSARPTLEQYLGALALYMEVNNHYTSIVNNEDGSVYFTVRPQLGYKFSVFLSECIRITLGSIADITKVEVTDTSIHIECAPRKA
jgi:predicted CopG family antitoxin